MGSVLSASRLPFGKKASQSSLLLLLATVYLPLVHAESPPITWQHVHPYPSGQRLTSAAWGPPGYVVVGWEREVLLSPDGQVWERMVLTNISGSFWITDKVCYDNGKYVVIGNPTNILWSADGRNWNVADPATNVWLRNCAGGDGKFLIAGDNHTLLVSTNAHEWEVRTVPANFTDMVYGNNLWIASTAERIYASTDLVNWTNMYNGSFGLVLNTVSYGQGRFIAAGAGGSDNPNGSLWGSVILTSTNGLVWDQIYGLDTAGEIKDSVFANDQFLAVRPNFFLRSTNGANWEKITGFDAGGDLNAVTASSSGQFLAVGAKGAMLKSADTQTWQLIASNVREYFNAISYADSRFVAVGGVPYYIGGPVGSAAVVTSTNGFDWVGSLTNLENQLSAVAYGNGLWVVCGDDGGIYTSTNAIDWTNNSLPPTSHDLHKLVYGNGRFVAFAIFRDLIYQSTNGVDWVGADTPLASEVGRVRYINGRFIGVGGDDDGFVFSSVDGLIWEKTTLAGTGWLAGVAYGKGRYVAVGRDVSAVSFDGTNWMTQIIPFSGWDVTFANGWFLAVGPNYVTMISRDGVQWELADSPVVNAYALENLAFGGGVVVANGGLSLYRGTISDSDEFKKRLRMLSPAQLEFYGAHPYEYRLEKSTNLVNWLPASDWTEGADQYLVWNVDIFQGSEKFWRTAGRLQ